MDVPEITDEQVSKAYKVWCVEASIPYMARIADYVCEDFNCPNRTEEFAALKVADLDAERKNTDLMRRTIQAAFQ